MQFLGGKSNHHRHAYSLGSFRWKREQYYFTVGCAEGQNGAIGLLGSPDLTYSFRGQKGSELPVNALPQGTLRAFSPDYQIALQYSTASEVEISHKLS